MEKNRSMIRHRAVDDFFIKDIEDEEIQEDQPIEWSNIIFLPFQPAWKILVLLSVLTKCTMELARGLNFVGALFCHILTQHKVAYLVEEGRPILGFSIRQVTEKAVGREYLPKRAFLILLDIMALVPFYYLVANELCTPAQLWPNVLVFNEIVIAYRVVEYFSLTVTHSAWQLIIGYFILLMLYINALTCFLLLLTEQGLCQNCHKGYYDWRSTVIQRMNKTTDNALTMHIFATSLVLALTAHRLIDETKPSTYMEFMYCIIVMVLGYILIIFIIMPKLFAEGIIHMRRIFQFHPRVNRIIEETKRRNSLRSAHLSVEQFYSLVWTNRCGITSMPDIISELPRHLRISIRQDLIWPVFQHSPTLRKASVPYKRWLADCFKLHYKLPGEKFFVGPSGFNNLYYIKSGIVQLISTEDKVSAILSVTGGTVFGDISFLIPPLNRKTNVLCLTYCEVYYISRGDILKSLHRFPEDRRNILKSAKDRIKHAQTLYNFKLHIKGLDRSEDEGIAWIRKRWWEINSTVDYWEKEPIKTHRSDICRLPPEETNYHCPKYIGQLVLTTNAQLQRKSLFIKVKFPWILAPKSVFGYVWHHIVIYTVYLVLIILPPVIASHYLNGYISFWFSYFLFFTDFIYLADIFVSLITAVEKNEQIIASFMAIFFERCKSMHFILDVLSTSWIENFVQIVNYPQYYYAVQFNRLLKIYMLFYNRYERKWYKDMDPYHKVVFMIALLYFVNSYVLCYFMFIVVEITPEMTVSYFFGELCISKNNTETLKKCRAEFGVFSILLGWLFEITFTMHQPKTKADVIASLMISVFFFMMGLFTKSRFIAAYYLKYREIVNYCFFVTNLKHHYIMYNTHPSLLKRLERYLLCHWKYYEGIDILYPNMLKEVPYDIYTKLHGDIAEKIIGESKAFEGADPILVRELAHKAKFLILPKKSTIKTFGIYAKNIVWLANGMIKCSYFHEGKIIIQIIHPGETVSLITVFLKRPALKTYVAETDCEVLYISYTDFYKTLERFPNELSFFQTCGKETKDILERTFQNYKQNYKHRQTKLRDSLMHSTRYAVTLTEDDNTVPKKRCAIFRQYRSDPESRFILYWMTFRVVFVVIGISSLALQGGSGAPIRPILNVIDHICNFISVIDILIKMFLPYYDNRGLIISDIRKCAIHYMIRGFFLDVIGSIPWNVIFDEILEGISPNDLGLLYMMLEFSHLYLLIGYFNYYADVPRTILTFLMIIKWQFVTILLMIGSSRFFISKCIEFNWDDNLNLVKMERKNSCWLPKYLKLDENPSVPQLHFVFSESLIVAQCGFLGINMGKFFVEEDKLSMSICLLLMGMLFWCMTGYCQTLLILYYRGNTVFQNGLNQLKKFLQAERVPKEIIDKSVNHFIYIWMRTDGVDVSTLMNERIGAVFRQDLSYFFFKRTITALDVLLGGGERLERLLASNAFQIHFLPSADILREMELSSSIYVVHRGKVIISKNGEVLATLSKGSIFGQLEGTTVRPIRISARSVDYVDLLHLSLKQFHDILDEEIRENIARNPQSQDDYMEFKDVCPENAYNTVEYFIFKDLKLIKMPWMLKPVSVENVWYSRWLFLVWLFGPVITAILILLIYALPRATNGIVVVSVLVLDILHVFYLVTEMFNMQAVVVENEIVDQYVTFKKLLQWQFCVDVISLLLPFLTLVTGVWDFQLARLLRLHCVFYYQEHFCQNFKTNIAPIMVKFTIVVLLLHALTCGWIKIACRSDLDSDFSVPNPKLPPNASNVIDAGQWISPNLRKNGCPSRKILFQAGGKEIATFVVPAIWHADYILALSYIITIHTNTNMDVVVPLTTTENFYKVFMTIVLYLVEMWITSVSISVIYTKLREMYNYDYRVLNLIKYLDQNGLSVILQHAVAKYTRLLWQRQQGNWLPEITQLAPACLREDILSALYMHHLESVPLFQKQPIYFLRQLAAKLNRVVIFPGNFIVKEGDIYPCMFFIHEGEVEKWFTDGSGEFRTSSLLSTNHHFGLIPGLFPDIPYKFAYCTRTVVDLVFLKYEDWQDLLNCYPEIKQDIYISANKIKR